MLESTTLVGSRNACSCPHDAVIRVYDEAGNLDLSGWDERIRKSKRRPKLPGRHQETVRFFNRELIFIKLSINGSAGGWVIIDARSFFKQMETQAQSINVIRSVWRRVKKPVNVRDLQPVKD